MIKQILKFFLYGLLLFSSHVFASTTLPMTGEPVARFNHLQSEIIYFMRKYQVPGASVAIMQNGKLLYARGIGWANVAAHEPVQPNSRFRIASISKAITAAAVIQLIQEHKIDYNTKIFSVLNDLQPRPGMHKNSRIDNIAVIDVLRMLSGWDGDQYIGFDPIFGPWPKSYARKLRAATPPSCKLAAEFMMGMPLQSIPGTHFSYANINYCLLGLLVSKVTGRPYGYQGYQNYVQTNLLEPMGITDMQIGSTTETLPNEVHYYGETNNHQFPYGDDDILHKAYSAGGWIATATDLVKFQYGLMHMLTKRSLAYIQQRPPGMSYKLIGGFYPIHYAMGWFITKQYNNTSSWVTHGSFTGTRSVLVKRTDGYVIAVIFNREPLPQGRALRKITYTLLHTKL